MRPIISFLCLVILLPATAKAQKWDVTELGGYSTTKTTVMGYNGESGFTNRLSLGYHIDRHFVIGAAFSYAGWNHDSFHSGLHTNCFTGALSADYTTKHFFAGADVNLSKLVRVNFNFESTVAYSLAAGFGIHTGLQQKIWQHIYAVEQVGCIVVPHVMTSVHYSGFFEHPFGESTITSGQLIGYYAYAGLSWRF